MLNFMMSLVKESLVQGLDLLSLLAEEQVIESFFVVRVIHVNNFEC